MRAVQPLIAQFLGMTEEEMIGSHQTRRAPTSQALKQSGQSGITNTALSSEDAGHHKARHMRGLSLPHLIDGLNAHEDGDGVVPSMPAMYQRVAESGETYIVSGR